MSRKNAYCEDCLEDIPGDEVYWEESRIYCGRCGSELELEQENTDLLDTCEGRKARPLYALEDNDYNDDENFF